MMGDVTEQITTYSRTWAVAVEHKKPGFNSVYGFLGTFLSLRSDLPQVEGIRAAQFYSKKAAVEYMNATRASDPKYWNGRKNRLFVVRTTTVTTTVPRHDWERIWTIENGLIPVVSFVPRKPINVRA